jgi:response regulator RpfG family c-di-GMP phosphodiesterase
MLTGNADQKTAMDAVNEGHVFRFLAKPCPPDTLAITLEAGLKQHRLITAERELLENTLNGAIKVLTGVLAIMDPGSFGLGEKLRDYMRTYTRHYHVPQPWALELAAMLSQIGHVVIPAAVLQKFHSGVGLRPEERDMLMRVPRTGADLLTNIPRLDVAARIVLYQHKNFDGSGFPHDEVAGDEIPMGARILKTLADLIELESKGRSRFKALAEMRARPGSYDPGVLNSVAACFDVSIPQSNEAEAPPIETPLKDIATGQVFAANVETLDGNLIVPAGTLVSPILLEKLRNFDHLQRLRQPLWVKQCSPIPTEE